MCQIHPEQNRKSIIYRERVLFSGYEKGESIVKHYQRIPVAGSFTMTATIPMGAIRPGNAQGTPHQSPTQAVNTYQPPVSVGKEYWKDVGYPGFSILAGSSNDLFVLRRFSALNARVIMLMQDRIVRLEQELDEEDRACLRENGTQADSGTFRHEPRPKRLQILEELEDRLKRYSKRW